LCVCVYHFCHVKWLIIEYVINMATTSKTLIKHKMLSFQGKLHIFKKVDATSNVPCTMSLKISTSVWTLSIFVWYWDTVLKYCVNENPTRKKWQQRNMTCMTYTIAVCTVINSWWWTDELSETCKVSFQNKFEKLVHLVGFIIRNYHDAQSHGSKIWVGRTVTDQVVPADVVSLSTILLKSMLCISKSLRKVKIKVWYDGESHLMQDFYGILF
jgi:hypothetical protein